MPFRNAAGMGLGGKAATAVGSSPRPGNLMRQPDGHVARRVPLSAEAMQ